MAICGSIDRPIDAIFIPVVAKTMLSLGELSGVTVLVGLS
jgi:hypothetical protein